MSERPNLFRQTKLSGGANEDMGENIFPVQLTTSRIDNYLRLIHFLVEVITIH